MKLNLNTTKFFHAALAAALLPFIPVTHAAQLVYEVEREFITSGDFDGDGKTDIALVDRATGRVRLGYGIGDGIFNWAEWRSSGLKDVSSVAVGRLADTRHDSLAFASADVNLASVLHAPSSARPDDAITLPVTTLGPNLVIAIDIGGDGNTPLHDLLIPTIYNSDPSPNLVTLFRNDGKTFKSLGESPTPYTGAHANRIALKRGGKEFAVSTAASNQGEQLLIGTLDNGRAEAVLIANDIPKGANYIVGNFRGDALCEFVFYQSGEPTLTVLPIQEADGKFQAGTAKTFTLASPIRQLAVVDDPKKSRLLAVYGESDPAELFDFDAVNAPVSAQKLDGATNKFLNAAIALPDGIVLFSSITNNRPVSHYQVHTLKGGVFVPGNYGSLPTLDNRDDSTIPEIHKRIVAATNEKSATDMKTYTNRIPGTEASYSMVAIPGGEFQMGSPDKEKDRKPDEGPQHRVKLAPFWMGQFEVTWDQYLLFMYPDDEKKLREINKSDEAANALADAVTHPSRPYVDMSFGMGKSGYPAIAMTQHGANKFCHWLSAKTGHFYRLPTEAEWEYACRAGSTTAYSFGDDASKLAEYAWFFDNSNSKYQKVGKKKPNAWGLYDMHGNVTEWVLDQYDENYYKSSGAATVENPWNKATQPYPHSVRGGSWDDDPPALRSAARRGSTRDWKMTDPQFPKGRWYLTDAQFIGFRFVRPLEVPSPEQMARYWISGVEKD